MRNEILIKLLKKRMFLHAFFWAVLAFSFSLGWVGAGYSWHYILANYFGTLAIYFIYINTTLYFAYGFFVPREKYLFSLLVFVVLLLCATQANALLYNVSNDQGRTISLQNFLPFYIFLAAFTLALKIARNAYLTLASEIAQKQELLNQKEYFLRSQIHPHFLFNTLNNFYGLALEKSNELPELMIRLSNILRHQIYNSEASFIALKTEVDYLKDYIALEKIRYGENLSFHFSFPERIPSQLFVMPSVLIVLFENAFKHSNTIASQLIEINGYMEVVDNDLVFFLENTYPNNQRVVYDKYEGMGLKNVTSRLSLMGEDHYSLLTETKNGKYSVSLRMKLKQQ